jgi:hypothetical protein
MDEHREFLHGEYVGGSHDWEERALRFAGRAG